MGMLFYYAGATLMISWLHHVKRGALVEVTHHNRT